MTSTSLISRLLLALALAGLLGCEQEEGDTCWEDDDCSGALVCCKSSPSARERGTCLPAAETCADIDPDGGPPDLGMDMGAEGDLGTDGGELDLGAEEDGGPEDMGADEDGGPEDGGSEDMGADEDGGSGDMG
jgi:hypothetical protein